MLTHACPRHRTLLVAEASIPPAIVGHEEGTLSQGAWQGAWQGVAPLVVVLKCPKCGYSLRMSEGVRIDPDPHQAAIEHAAELNA